MIGRHTTAFLLAFALVASPAAGADMLEAVQP